MESRRTIAEAGVARRSPSVEHSRRYCEVCQTVTDHALHRQGIRAGMQRYQLRCMPCHSRRNCGR
jgi:hypothetical protein